MRYATSNRLLRLLGFAPGAMPSSSLTCSLRYCQTASHPISRLPPEGPSENPSGSRMQNQNQEGRGASTPLPLQVENGSGASPQSLKTDYLLVGYPRLLSMRDPYCVRTSAFAARPARPIDHDIKVEQSHGTGALLSGELAVRFMHRSWIGRNTCWHGL